jgi:hypothetical protein
MSRRVRLQTATRSGSSDPKRLEGLNLELGIYHRQAVPFTVEDLARTALVRILPRKRYRLAAQTDSRFQSFASNTTRIAYRQQGSTPAFLLFSGPGQNPHAAAMAAATWAEANWRPNAIQRKVRPGVVAVLVAPGNQLVPAGPVAGAVVPSAVWTVDSAAGKVEAAGNPPGSPSASELRHAARALMHGEPAPTLGELDLAERGVMQLRTVTMPRAVSGLIGIFLLYFAFRYGLGGLFSLMILPALLSGTRSPGALLAIATLAVNALLLLGILLGAGVALNFRNMALRVPGFSSASSARRNGTWGGYVAVMIGLAIALDVVIPAAERQSIVNAGPGQYTHVSATVSDDGSATSVVIGGDLTVDLSGWPSAEWSGVQFKTSNPSVLSLDAAPIGGGPPIARFTPHQVGVSRIDATSSDGRYTFQIRVDVGAASP